MRDFRYIPRRISDRHTLIAWLVARLEDGVTVLLGNGYRAYSYARYDPDTSETIHAYAVHTLPCKEASYYRCVFAAAVHAVKVYMENDPFALLRLTFRNDVTITKTVPTANHGT